MSFAQRQGELSLAGTRSSSLSTPNRRRARRSRQWPGLAHTFFGVLAVVCDFSAVLVSAAASGWVYHHLFFGVATPLGYLQVQGAVIAILFVVTAILRGEYSLNHYLLFSGHVRRVFLLWNMALLTAVLLAFLTKTSDLVSRGTAILFYCGGFAFVCMIRLVMVRIVRAQAEAGRITNRRVFLIGFEDDVRSFVERHQPWSQGIEIVASAIIREPQSLEDDLALAAASAPVMRPEDIFILAPLTQRAAIEACLSALQMVPATIHLVPERMFDGVANVQTSQIGSIYSLNLARKPLPRWRYTKSGSLILWHRPQLFWHCRRYSRLSRLQ